MQRWWIFLLLFCSLFLSHCGTGAVTPSGEDPTTGPGEGENETIVDPIGAAPACEAGTIGYPVMDRRAYTHIYRNRGFYADGNHLGLDLGYPEGTPIYPIAPGVIRVYRPASGYGTLVVVIEHCTRLGFQATNGVGTFVHGQRFLTIYGHLRRTSGYGTGRTLAWQVGSRVTPYDIVGYIQRDSDNGDGAEHVHLGVRLQTMSEAMAADPAAWFRGYDSASSSQRRWFADPARFYRELADQILQLDDPGAYAETPFPPPPARDAGVALRDAMSVTTDVLLASRDSGLGVPVDAEAPAPADAESPRPPAPDVPPVPPPAVDAGVPTIDVSMAVDAGPPPRPRESCNGLDDDGDGFIDEDFLCPLGRHVDLCATSCGSIGFLACEAPSCQPGTICHLFPENCSNGGDDDCDGLHDCADPDCRAETSCLVRDAGVTMADLSVPPLADASTSTDISVFVPPPSPVDAGVMADTPSSSADVGSATGSVIRYEFRVLESAGWGATAPYRLRDRWWTMSRCDNTGTTTMEPRADGWYRCDLHARLSPFVGSFYSPLHPDWGDRGNLGTVGNSPDRCTPTEGVEWRITDLTTSRAIFSGTSAELPCVAEGTQDRHRLP